MRLSAATLAIIFVFNSACAQAEGMKPKGMVWIPLCSKRVAQRFIAGREGEARAFTNIQVFVPDVRLQPPAQNQAAATPYFIETPASIACVYGLVPRQNGCKPAAVNVNASGGGRVIAIVDAYDAPKIKEDLVTFSDRFGLPAPSFDVVYASNHQPANDKGWEIEISLDVEWAHAMAPQAKIILVEAEDNQYSNLFAAVDKASSLVAAAGGGQVSLSWGGSEFGSQLGFDSHFAKPPGVVYLAASGDDPGVSYPATSQAVIAVGGTSIDRDSTGTLIGETPWTSEGAGPSLFEALPTYQNSMGLNPGMRRAIVDVAAIADPSNGGVWVYDSSNSNAAQNNGWLAVGGTSAATPIVAGIINNAGRFASNTGDELSYMYAHMPSFNDIKTGTCGPVASYTATTGWDYCTGVGTPNGKGGL